VLDGGTAAEGRPSGGFTPGFRRARRPATRAVDGSALGQPATKRAKLIRANTCITSTERGKLPSGGLPDRRTVPGPYPKVAWTSGLRVNRISITAVAEGNRENSVWCECCRSKPLTSGAFLPPVFRPKDSNGIARRGNETCQRRPRRGETDYRGL
jgi:hypothetical protein